MSLQGDNVIGDLGQNFMQLDFIQVQGSAWTDQLRGHAGLGSFPRSCLDFSFTLNKQKTNFIFLSDFNSFANCVCKTPH